MPKEDWKTSEYLEFFHFIVTSGICCGLDHPIQWAINAIRTPGGTFSPDYYKTANKWVPYYLVDMYLAEGPAPEPKIAAKTIIDWTNSHYPDGHMVKGFFNGWEAPIQEAIDIVLARL